MFSYCLSWLFWTPLNGCVFSSLILQFIKTHITSDLDAIFSLVFCQRNVEWFSWGKAAPSSLSLSSEGVQSSSTFFLHRKKMMKRDSENNLPVSLCLSKRSGWLLLVRNGFSLAYYSWTVIMMSQGQDWWKVFCPFAQSETTSLLCSFKMWTRKWYMMHCFKWKKIEAKI